MTDWQLIVTAPRDGSRILTTNWDLDYMCFHLAVWDQMTDHWLEYLNREQN